MIKLNTTSTKQYYFIKNGVIFNIASSYDGFDRCAIEMGGGVNDDSLPSIYVEQYRGDNLISTASYYLDTLIKDGDTYKVEDTSSDITNDADSVDTSTDGVEGDESSEDGDEKESEESEKPVFKHTKHSAENPDSEEASEEFYEYFIELCKQEIGKTIIDNPTKDFEYFSSNLDKLGVPLYVIEGTGYNVYDSKGSTAKKAQITFDEEAYKEYKKKGVLEKVYESANKEAKKYSYKLTNDTEIKIEEII